MSAMNYANGKKYFSFFVRDVSQHKYMEQIKNVEEASQAKSIFVSSSMSLASLLLVSLF